MEYDLLNQEIRRVEKDDGVTRSFYDSNGNQNRTTYRLDAWSTNMGSVESGMLDFAIRAGALVFSCWWSARLLSGALKRAVQRKEQNTFEP